MIIVPLLEVINGSASPARTQRRVAGVAALVHDVLRGLLLEPDLDELLAVGVVFAVVRAQAALAFV